MGILYLLVSAALATVASLIFVFRVVSLPFLTSLTAALFLWSPSNWVFTKAQDRIKDPATTLIVFSISTTIFDTLGGMIFQHTRVSNVFMLLAGLLVGVFVIVRGSKSKNYAQPEVGKEITLYVAGAVSLLATLVFQNYWYVLVFVYAVTDLVGAVLMLRLLGWASGSKKHPEFTQYLIGLISFAPVTFVVLFMFRALSTISIVGPAATIAGCGVAMVGSKWLTGNKILFKDINYLLLSVVCVLLIYVAFI